MQIKMRWFGSEYDAMEDCVINMSEKGIWIASTIVGTQGLESFKVAYDLQLDTCWQTQWGTLQYEHGKTTEILDWEHYEDDTWSINGIPRSDLDGCTDIDIPITPFTNSLPINRLNLSNLEINEVKVVYLDLFAYKINMVRQKYQRLSAEYYRYENIPNDFEAEIKVDAQGFVIDYPPLFVRTSKVESNELFKKD